LHREEGKNSLFWGELKSALKDHKGPVILIWLLISITGFGHLIEVLPGFESIVSHHLYRYFLEFHDLLALAIAAYGSYRYGMGVLVLGMLGFLAWHGYYFYEESMESAESLEHHLPNFLRMGVSTGSALVVGLLIKDLRLAREEVGKNLESVQTGLRHLEGLHGIALAATEAQDINTLFRRAVSHIRKATDMEFASVHGFQEQAGQLLLLAQEGWSQDQAKQTSLFAPSGMLSEALQSGKIVVDSPPLDCSTPVCNLMAELGAKVCMAVPLITDGRTVGVITLARRKEGQVLDDTLVWLEALGHELGVYLHRLISIKELERQKASAQGLARKLEEERGKIVQGVLRYAETAAMAVEIHHPVLEGHHRRVAEMSVRLAKKLGWQEGGIASLQMAAKVHDIGLFQVPVSDIGVQDPVETRKREALKFHTIVAVNQLQPLGEIYEPALAAIRSHHERWDGAGYPDGTSYFNIPEAGRLLAIVETYDHLRLGSPGRQALSQTEALNKIVSLSGSALDPGMAEGFLSLHR